MGPGEALKISNERYNDIPEYNPFKPNLA